MSIFLEHSNRYPWRYLERYKGTMMHASAVVAYLVESLPKRSGDTMYHCGITTHVPTTRKRGGFEVRERSLVGYPREGITVRKGLEKTEGSRGR